jgi:hypothetical protein
MKHKVTYYAIVDDLSSREEPAGVLRRVEDEEGESDEVFTRDLVWKRSSSLYAAERGNLDNRFFEITEDEANRIVERIRATVTGTNPG